MKMVKIFDSVLVIGLAVLGLIFLGVSVCADFDPERAIAGCAFLATSRYLS